MIMTLFASRSCAVTADVAAACSAQQSNSCSHRIPRGVMLSICSTGELKCWPSEAAPHLSPFAHTSSDKLRSWAKLGSVDTSCLAPADEDSCHGVHCATASKHRITCRQVHTVVHRILQQLRPSQLGNTALLHPSSLIRLCWHRVKVCMELLDELLHGVAWPQLGWVGSVSWRVRHRVPHAYPFQQGSALIHLPAQAR